MEQRLQIKLFSGTQLGATLDLEHEQLITIGGDYSNDVFLDLPEGTALSASFMLSGGFIKFNSLDGQIEQIKYNKNSGSDVGSNASIDVASDAGIDSSSDLGLGIGINAGGSIALDQEYTLPCFLTAGGVKFAIGYADDIAEWPLDATDDIKENNKNNENNEDNIHNPSDLNVGSDIDNDFNNDLDNNSGNHSNFIYDDDDDANELLNGIESEINSNNLESSGNKSKDNKSSESKSNKAKLKSDKFNQLFNQLIERLLKPIKNMNSRVKILFYSGIVVFIMLILGSVLLVPLIKQNNQVALKASNLNSASSAIKKIFIELPVKYANLTLQPIAKGYQISGLVATLDEANELHRIFANYASFIDFKVITSGVAIQQIKTILTTMNFGQLNVVFDPISRVISLPGWIKVTLRELTEVRIK